jgi:hypothetical protein
MTGRDVICRDAPRVVDVDEDANEVGRRWTGRAEERRLREGDVRHAVGCAVAQADGDGGCKYKGVRGGSGERCRTECDEGFFDDKRMLLGR